MTLEMIAEGLAQEKAGEAKFDWEQVRSETESGSPEYWAAMAAGLGLTPQEYEAWGEMY